MVVDVELGSRSDESIARRQFGNVRYGLERGDDAVIEYLRDSLIAVTALRAVTELAKPRAARGIMAGAAFADDVSLLRAAPGTTATIKEASRGAQLRAVYGKAFKEYAYLRNQGFTPTQARSLTNLEPLGGNRLSRFSWLRLDERATAMRVEAQEGIELIENPVKGGADTLWHLNSKTAAHVDFMGVPRAYEPRNWVHPADARAVVTCCC
jgi:hypothetical protein